MADITVSSCQASEYWGSILWDANSGVVSGISLTSGQGSVSITANADVSVSGIQITSSQGTTVGGTSALVRKPWTCNNVYRCG